MGFFGTRSDAKQPKRVREAPPSEETLWKLGLRGVRDMNRKARSPMMEATGCEDPSIYFLGWVPEKEDDENGTPFSGAAGRYLRRNLPRGVDKDARYNNCVGTFVERDPKTEEVECFRPSVIEDIEKSKPNVVVALGYRAFNWAQKLPRKIDLLRGRAFPAKFGNHTCWLFVTYDPAFVKMAASEKRFNKKPGEEYRVAFQHDLDAAYDLARSTKEPFIASKERDDMLEGVEIFTPDDRYAARRICTALAKLSENDKEVVAVDIETTGLRARDAGARILSVAFSTGDYTLAFPFDHNKARWGKEDYKAIKKSIYDWLLSPCQKVAHNTLFELDWFIALVNDRVFPHESLWHDTQALAYVLDVRRGGHSLDFACRQNLGLPLKELSSKVDVRDAEGADVDDLLTYNAWDAKYTRWVFDSMMAQVEEQGLKPIYSLQIERLPTLAGARAIGFRVDVDFVKDRYKDLKKRLESSYDKLLAFPEVQKVVRKFGEMNVLSQDHVTYLVRDVMGRQDLIQKDGKFSTKKDVLGKVDHPAMEPLLLAKQLEKLIGTYTEPLIPGHSHAVIYPDHRIHPVWKPTDTESGRLASEDPNGQNFPKRTKEGKQARRAFKPEPGYKILSIDFGQIEARVFASASNDTALLQALYDKFDIHGFWAKYVAELYPPTFKARGSDMKRFRNDMKTDLVFKCFYGAQEFSVRRGLDLPRDVAKKLYRKFWDTYPKVRAWQRRNQKTYEDHYYVETLTGRRRHGPLSENQITNTPIQGTASDIVVAGMNALAWRSIEVDKPWIHPVLNIHDDLTFVVPEKKLDEAIEICVLEMLSVKFPWLTAPLSVEAEVGDDWSSMSPVGEFHSHELLTT